MDEIFYKAEQFKPDDIITVKGNTDGFESELVKVMSEFIEEQKNKDLLDMPRVRQLEVPALLDDGMDPIVDSPKEVQGETLLALDSDSEEELVPNIIGGATKYWLSPGGGLGCFATGFRNVLAEVAKLTGTRISVIDNRKGIQISGKGSDVDDAFAKLAGLEKPLALIANPQSVNLAFTSEDTRLQIKSYGSLNNVALRRILTDPYASSNLGLHEAYVTVLIYYDVEAESFTVPENLRNPPHATNEPGQSRIWTDFTFQELGKGNTFINLQPSFEKDPQAVSTRIVASHPYLTAEKANLVNKWRADTGAAELLPEINDILQPTLSSEEAVPPPPAKKTPRIKTRRAVAPQGQIVKQVKPEIPSGTAPITSEKTKAIVSNSGRKSSLPPRRKWAMTYQPLSNNAAGTLDEKDGEPVSKALAEAAPDPSSVPVPQTPERKSRVPINFDASKYGLNSDSRYVSKDSKAGSTQKISSPSKTPNKSPRKQSLLVDVLAPTINLQPNIQPLISFDQPALVPQNLPILDSLEDLQDPCTQKQSVLNTANTSSSDEAMNESVLENKLAVLGSNRASDVTSMKEERTDDIEKRLSSLKSLAFRQEAEIGSNGGMRMGVQGPPRSRFADLDFMSVRIADLEKDDDTEGKPGIDELDSRKFHRTMLHKTAKLSEKAKAQKAKRQATLEDAWGWLKKPNKEANVPQSEKKAADDIKEKLSLGVAEAKSVKPAMPNFQEQQRLQVGTSMDDYIKHLFEALKPILDAAEYFPGTLTLECQVGLILIPLLPKTYRENTLISTSEWNRIFQPRNGLPPPTTKFINRLTTSGADVDYIVDMKRSKAEGKARLFEQEYTDYSVVYEYHCRTNADQILIITIDETGKFSVRGSTKTLGAVNLHFPRQTWDASIVVSGVMEHNSVNLEKDIRDAVQYIIDSLWVQPDRSLSRIFTRVPKDNKLAIEKVFMKRWTRHRYIRLGDALKDTDTLSPEDRGAETVEKSETYSSVDQTSATSQSSIENQDIFLQIMEVQDLFLGTNPLDPQAVRANCAPIREMVEKGRQWYEVSVVSPSIEAILKANSNLEMGERTDDWRSLDLLGNDASIVLPDSNATARPALSRVASVIGDAGLGEMLRLTKMVVEKIDGIGVFNVGPYIDRETAEEVNFAGPTVALSTVGPLVKAEAKGVDFDELESIKGVGSASQAIPPAKSRELEELEFW
ncbi:hypothetical protein MPDQ_002781 [Monascus purpureus]|uniref:Uncharacterized protein n=1 Tax=Monascus purpureus TaxID=5098 RepID=A0A507R238_MONPU|nr:hypothetical protein MPDQ_002781 [Monascus purpureus]